MITQAWLNAWEYVTPFLAFPPELRRVVYTTNAIEALNRQLRKAIKTKGHFPNEEAARKLIYLAITNAVPAWTRTRNWTTALLAFKIHFGDRLPESNRLHRKSDALANGVVLAVGLWKNRTMLLRRLVVGVRRCSGLTERDRKRALGRISAVRPGLIDARGMLRGVPHPSFRGRLRRPGIALLETRDVVGRRWVRAHRLSRGNGGSVGRGRRRRRERHAPS